MAPVPSLESLDIWSDPEPLLRVLRMSTITHLKACPNAVPNDVFEPVPLTAAGFNAVVQRCRALRSLSLLHWHCDEDEPVDSQDVDSWFLGKDQLVAVAVPVEAMMLASARAFMPGNLPALRYLAMESGIDIDYNEGGESSVLNEITAMLAASPVLHIMLYDFPLQTVRDLRAMIGKERTSRLVIAKRWYSSMEKIVREHNKGVADCLGPYR